MATETPNFKLNKPDRTDFVNIKEQLSDNMDKIDAALGNSSRFEKAGGTETAITLTNIVMEDGYSKSFIISENNNGVVTTINGKKLYKSGTTTAPNLIAGKAVTVWYSQANDCFYADVGGDADTLGGKSTDDFTIPRMETLDANTATKNGGYLILNTASNAPFSDTWATLLTMQGGTGAILQIALSEDSRAANRHFNGVTWSEWKEVSATGHKHTKSEISDFPTSLPANAIIVPDARSTNNTPEWYISNYPARTVVEFKTSNIIGLSGATYVGVVTVVPYPDASGGYPFQYTVVAGVSFKYRYGTSETTWSAWLTVSNEGHTHGAASITAGALPIGVTAAGANTDYGTARLRNIYAGTADLTAGSSAVPSGYIYIVYE